MFDQITALILTYNEAPNIGRILERLDWARDIVVVDSFSDDDTVEDVPTKALSMVLNVAHHVARNTDDALWIVFTMPGTLDALILVRFRLPGGF